MAGDAQRSWRLAHVLENRPVAQGSLWMTLEVADEWPAAYEPGHVLGMGVQLPNGYIRHAYTVSRGEPRARRFGVLYRVIPRGHLSPRLAALTENAPVWFF